MSGGDGVYRLCPEDEAYVQSILDSFDRDYLMIPAEATSREPVKLGSTSTSSLKEEDEKVECMKRFHECNWSGVCPRRFDDPNVRTSEELMREEAVTRLETRVEWSMNMRRLSRRERGSSSTDTDHEGSQLTRAIERRE